ncbi:hypothetical protein WP12_06630 [Sphingomonas sp. SRS2]|nr:hypothetical protein WP12_06630 [Sphingomonas sp. SRS2]
MRLDAGPFGEVGHHLVLEGEAGDRLPLRFRDPRHRLEHRRLACTRDALDRERAVNLSNQRLFNVGVTRVRDELTMIVDDKEKLERQLDMNPGNKTSALETLGRLDIDGKKGPGAQPREKFDPGPIDGVDLSDLPPLVTDLPPLPDNSASASAAKNPKAPPDVKSDRSDPLPPLPERSLGLDL